MTKFLNGRRPKPSLTAIGSGIIGGLLLWYGWERRTGLLGLFSSTIGLSLLAKTPSDPALIGLLGPLQGYFAAPFEAAQKLLA